MKFSLIAVGIKHSGNLGALARLCRNYDIKELILVNPKADIDDEAYERATWGRPYLDNIVILNNLMDSRKYVDTLIALSARIGGYNSLTRSSYSIKKTALEMKDFQGHIGIVLGPEDYGLSNQELDDCDFLCHISLPGENQVLNITHAAATALWELSRLSVPEMSVDEENEPLHNILSADKKRVLFEYLDEILPHTWIRNDKFEGIRTVFKQILGRAFITEREGNALVGTFRGIHSTLNKGHPYWDKCSDDDKNES